MKNLSIENITKACRGTFHGDESILSQEVSGVVIDSRKVQPGYLFVAIDGERVNAHKFIPDTVKAGVPFDSSYGTPALFCLSYCFVLHRRSNCGSSATVTVKSKNLHRVKWRFLVY